MRMRKKLAAISLALLLCGFSVPPAAELERRACEMLLNTALRSFFSGTLKIRQAHMGRDFRLRLAGLSGELVTRERPVRIEMAEIRSEDPLYRILALKPMHFRFSGLKPSGPAPSAISGTAMLLAGRKWNYEVSAQVENLGIEEISWVNPDSLAGASGSVSGQLTLGMDYSGHSQFVLRLAIPEPGGSLQARFFDAVTPYLPQKLNQKKLQELSQTQELIHYTHASLEGQLEEDERVKMLLRISIPDYNLNLNLNVLVRVDEKNAFLKLFQLLGILQTQPSK